MEDEHYWDQVAIMTKEVDGKKFIATVVSSRENKFEVITTMEEERVVITVPLNMLTDIGNHIRDSMSEDEIEAINRVAQNLREKNDKNAVIPIGDFVKKHHDKISDKTFAPMTILMDRCRLLFEDHFNLPHGSN